MPENFGAFHPTYGIIFAGPNSVRAGFPCATISFYSGRRIKTELASYVPRGCADQIYGLGHSTGSTVYFLVFGSFTNHGFTVNAFHHFADDIRIVGF